MISLNQSEDKIGYQEAKKDDEILKQIDKYHATMLSYIARLYEVLNGEKLDFTNVKNAVDALAKFNKKSEYNYLNNLLHPEKCKGVKIPSPIPVPSCSFQLHNCVTLSTNSSGNLAFVFNPYFLANQNDTTALDGQLIYPDASTTYYRNGIDWFSSFWYNNHETLAGNTPNENWSPMNIGQTIPNVYDQYRLVSASIVVKYIGRLDITSGVIGGAIIYDDIKNIGAQFSQQDASGPITTAVTANYLLAKYGNFDLAMDSFYHQENLCLEGMRELYFPLDNSYEEYTKLAGASQITPYRSSNDGGSDSDPSFRIGDIDNYKAGFNQFVYVLGAPPSSACFKVDIYCNFECLPNASFLNYLPLSMNANSISNVEKKNAITVVQQKPVMSTKDSTTIVIREPSIWEKLKRKFSNSLPGIGKLISKGLLSMVPGLKPGLALAGNMLGMASEQMEEEVE